MESLKTALAAIGEVDYTKWYFDGRFYNHQIWTKVSDKLETVEAVVDVVKKTRDIRALLKKKKLPLPEAWYFDGTSYHRQGARWCYNNVKDVVVESQNIATAIEFLEELRDQLEEIRVIVRQKVMMLKRSVDETFEGQVFPEPDRKKNVPRISNFTIDLTNDDDDDDDADADGVVEKEVEAVVGNKNKAKSSTTAIGHAIDLKDPVKTVKKIASFIFIVVGLSKIPDDVLNGYVTLATHFWIVVSFSHVLHDLDDFVTRYSVLDGVMKLVDDKDTRERGNEGSELETRLTLLRQACRDVDRNCEALVETISPVSYIMLIRCRNGGKGGLLEPSALRIAVEDIHDREDDEEEADKDDKTDDDLDDFIEKRKKGQMSATTAMKLVALWDKVRAKAEKKRLRVPDESVFRDFMDAVAEDCIDGFVERMRARDENTWWIDYIIESL